MFATVLETTDPRLSNICHIKGRTSFMAVKKYAPLQKKIETRKSIFKEMFGYKKRLLKSKWRIKNFLSTDTGNL